MLRHAIKCEMAAERTYCLRPQVRLALELVFEGLQAAGLPGGSIKSGGNGSEQNTAQHSLRIGDAVTVTLAAPAQPLVGTAPSAKQAAAQAAKADGAATPAAKLGASVQDGDGGDAAPQPPQHLLLEWQGGALPDMLADAVIAVLLQVLILNHPTCDYTIQAVAALAAWPLQFGKAALEPATVWFELDVAAIRHGKEMLPSCYSAHTCGMNARSSATT